MALAILVLWPTNSLWAQLASGNTAGLAMGHLHYYVRDVEANKKFWIALGGHPLPDVGAVLLDRPEVIKFPDVLVVLSRGAPTGGTEGSVVNHVAFRVPSLATVEAAGFKVARLQQFPGVASVMTPEGERIELFDNTATNLTFVVEPGYEGGPDAGVIERHNRPLTLPIAFHHVHLYVPEGQAPEAKAWYARMFGGIRGKRSQYDATDLPGINLNFSTAPRPTVPTKGRMLDHIGFEVRNLANLCKRLEQLGVKFEQGLRNRPNGVSTATIIDPWGTTIELTEGLRGM